MLPRFGNCCAPTWRLAAEKLTSASGQTKKPLLGAGCSPALRSGPGFRAAHRASPKSRPVSPLRASILAGKPALTPARSACCTAYGPLRVPARLRLATLRAVLESDGIRWPRPALNLPHSPACTIKGLSRHMLTRCAPCAIPRPLDRAGQYGRPGLPRPPETVWHHQERICALQVQGMKRPYRPRLKAFIDRSPPSPSSIT